MKCSTPVDAKMVILQGLNNPRMYDNKAYDLIGQELQLKIEFIAEGI